MIVATMVIKDDASETDAKALAEKYAKQLKEEHKDMKVNVQAVQKGKNVADITIEK